MKILVTGSNGQVGHELARLGAVSPHEVKCFDREQLDICNETQMRGRLLDIRPDVVINAAAYTAVDRAEAEPGLAYAVNQKAPRLMAEICNEIGSALLHISTDYVFAGESDGPYLETDTTAPSGVYGASKLAGEQAIAALCPRHIILRTSWVFGRHGNNFVKTMIRLAQTRDSLGVVSDQVGAPTSAAGIAEALLRIVDRLVSGEIRWGTYHYTGAPHTTWHGFADSIFADADDRGMLPSAMNLRAIATSEYPTPAKRPANSRLNCDKIKQEFGIQPDNWRNQLGAVLDSLHGVDQ